MTTDRELRAELDVDAPAERVWEVLTDFSNLADASPELVAMVPLKPGGLKTGQWYVGWNRRAWVLWPTRNVVREVVPGRKLVWDTTTSGARWIYEIEQGADGGSTIVVRRPVPKRLTVTGKVFAKTLLGGGESHADELEAALGTTLAHLKAVAER